MISGKRAHQVLLAAAFASLPLGACSEVADPRLGLVAAVEVAPPAAILGIAGQTRQFSAVAKDARGNTVSGVTFTWRSEDPAVATIDATGLATATGSGTTAVTASVDNVGGVALLTVDQEIVAVAIVVQPGDVIAGEAIRPAIAVELQDAGGYRVTDAAVPITLALGANPGGATLGGTVTVTSTGGVARFTDIWLNKAGAGYALTASTDGHDPVASAAFAVSPGPVQLAFLSHPSTAEGQVPFDPVVQVAAGEDRFGNTVTAAEVTLSFVVSPTAEALRGTTTVTAVNGVAMFPGLSLALPGDGFVLGATSGSAIPARSAPFSVRLTFAQVSAGDSHSCAVTVAGFAYCWGSTYGFTPRPVAGDLRFVEVSAGGSQTCGVATSQIAYCWGVTPTPVDENLRFQRLSVGIGHVCGVSTDQTAYCWGSNGTGQVGDGSTDQRFGPTPIDGSLRFADVSTAWRHTCGITTTNAAYCWGYNGTGQLGDGTAEERHSPALVVGQLAFIQASAGSEHTCGVTVDNAAYCWGVNLDGQLGDGTSTLRVVPTAVAGGLAFRQVTSSGRYRHTCAVTTGNAVYCWGFGSDGQLGNGVGGHQLEPTLVTGGLAFLQVSAGTYHTCAVTTDHVAYCWGLNSNGQVGDGTAAHRAAPVRVVQ